MNPLVFFNTKGYFVFMEVPSLGCIGGLFIKVEQDALHARNNDSMSCPNQHLQV